MFQLVPTEQLGECRTMFSSAHLAMVLDSIIAGNTAAEVWQTDQYHTPPLVVLWDKGNNVFYFAGEKQTNNIIQDLASMLTTVVRGQALAQGANYFKARVLSTWLEQYITNIFDAIPLRSYPMRFFTDSGAPLPMPMPMTANVVWATIDQTLLARNELGQRDQVLNEISWMWPTVERFYDHGFGVVALVAQQIVCWCTAEYVGPTHCGIGITTAPGFEQQGIATATAARFIQVARERERAACWECGQRNMASLRVAEKLGFVAVADETYWVGNFDD